MFELFISFFKTGLLAVGGGLATLPFLYEMAEKYDWITVSDISNLIAVSESTPGPLGVNMATYVGFINDSVIGAIIATLGLILPSLLIILIISTFLDKFKENQIVKNVFYGLRAASCALIAVAGLGVCKIAFFTQNTNIFLWQSAILAAVLLFVTRKLKWHPIIFIALSAIVGIIFKF